MIPQTLQRFQAPRWHVVAASDVGHVRRRQEDAWSVLLGTSFAAQSVDVFGVFDGLGGEPNGQEASRAAKEALGATLASANGIDDVLPALEPHVDATGRMTTAAVGVFFRGRPGWGYVVAAGDSAAYRLLRGKPDLLIDKDRAAGSITSCLGGGLLTAHSAPVQFAKGETFLFCTDGVDEVVGSRAVGAAMSVATPRLEQGVRELFDEIDRRGAPDNATVVIARFE